MLRRTIEKVNKAVKKRCKIFLLLLPGMGCISSGKQGKIGFSFNSGLQQNWNWFATGKHIEVRNFTCQRMRELRLPNGLAEYWICCFYPNYLPKSGLMDMTAVKGLPFLEFACPPSFLCESWTGSIQKARSKLMDKHGFKLDDDLAG